MKVIEVNSDNFKEEVLESNIKVLIDFSKIEKFIFSSISTVPQIFPMAVFAYIWFVSHIEFCGFVKL